MKVPTEVDGLQVLEFAILPEKLRPFGYIPPADGSAWLPPIDLIVIAEGPGPDGEPVYWVSCLDEAQNVVTGDMYYSIESARDFPRIEYGVSGLSWRPVIDLKR